VVFGVMPEHPLLGSIGVPALAEVLATVFFASQQTEEGQHQPIRLVLTTPAATTKAAGGPGELRFRVPCRCTTRQLLRLARGARSERISIAVAPDPDGLWIVGLARERLAGDESAFVRIIALQPGRLEIWVSGQRVLEYAHGYVQRRPEDVLLTTGPVREKLLAFADASGAPAVYVESVASVVRHLAEHPHGGILVLSAETAPDISAHTAFALEPDTHLWDLLHAMQRLTAERGQFKLEQETLRSEIQRSIGEIAAMTALDGATILDRRLGLCGFGIILPVRSDVSVQQVMDAAGVVRRAFPLQQYGARHRAAASYAATHPGSLVFIASVSGDIGCMLSEAHGSAGGQNKSDAREHVLLWRFRSGDLSSPPR
jgi:hypothetical protein